MSKMWVVCPMWEAENFWQGMGKGYFPTNPDVVDIGHHIRFFHREDFAREYAVLLAGANGGRAYTVLGPNGARVFYAKPSTVITKVWKGEELVVE